MKNISNPQRLKVATRAIVTGLVAFSSVTLLHCAHAAQKISDAELAAQSGGSTYYTGKCNTTKTWTPCAMTPAFSATCAWLSADIDDGSYKDKLYKSRVCSSNPKNPNKPPGCSNSGSVYVVERRYFSVVAANSMLKSPICRFKDEGDVQKNYSGNDLTLCSPVPDCR